MKTRFHQGVWLLAILLTSANAGSDEPLTQEKTIPNIPGESYPIHIIVNISPPEAVAAGAQWKFNTDTVWRDSGVYYTNLQTGAYLLEFAPINGWITPTWNSAIVVEGGSMTIVVSYAPLPRFPLEVSSSTGGYVRGRSELPPPWTGSIDMPEPDALKSFRWETAINLPGTHDFVMPAENANHRMRLWALAYPNYQFIGWSGDVISMRNLITLSMNEPKRLRANFARAIGSRHSAILAGNGYYSPGLLSLYSQVNYPADQQLRSLRWRPVLPEGWKLAGVNGLGSPQIQQGDIVFTANLGHNPIQFELSIDVPEGQSGPMSIEGQVEFAIEEITNIITRPIESLSGNPLSLTPLESPAAKFWLASISGLCETIAVIYFSILATIPTRVGRTP